MPGRAANDAVNRTASSDSPRRAEYNRLVGVTLQREAVAMALYLRFRAWARVARAPYLFRRRAASVA
jgi:hypothetical protein